jgi:hypothetical protein
MMGDPTRRCGSVGSVGQYMSFSAGFGIGRGDMHAMLCFAVLLFCAGFGVLNWIGLVESSWVVLTELGRSL